MNDDQSFFADVARLLQLPPAKVGAQTNLQDLAPDSLALVEMVIDIQDEFGVILHQNDFQGVETLGDLAKLIAARKRAALSGEEGPASTRPQ
jgi:acyl carrier protein